MKRITEYTEITDIAESDVVPIVDVSDTDQATTGSTKKGTIEKIADYLKARTETQTNKTLTSPVLNTPDINTPDISGGTIDGTDISGGTIASDTNVVEVLKKVYPIGCIYTSTVGTNPNTLFGFGTWSAFGAGKVMVGLDSTDTDFDTAEKTGGAKTHTLTTAQIPSHNHGTEGYRNTAGTGNLCFELCATATNPGYTTASTGGGEAHNNLQPYITVYFYKRTA